jgi:tryptophanyl-tRNA synthetase
MFDFQNFFDHLSCSEEIHDNVEHSLLDLISNGFDCSKFSKIFLESFLNKIVEHIDVHF